MIIISARIILGVFFGLALIYWLGQLLLIIRVIRAVPVMEKLNPREPAKWPMVSVVIPARNEEKTIREAVATRLEDDYPELEMILIDDRSTDQTGEIVDEFARRDPRVKPVHIKDLPPDWLGKQFAMNEGVKAATGEWLLFSDADIHVRRGTVRKAVAYAEERKLDHLPIFPDIYPAGFLLDILNTIFIRQISLAARIWAVENPRSKAAIGSGSFNLVRRTALERSRGFEWIRMESADDAALGKALKECGARESLVNGRGYVSVHFYASLRAMMVGADRPTYTTIGNFSFWRLFVMGLIFLLLELSPYLALLPLGLRGLGFLGAAMALISYMLNILTNLWFRRPVWTSFFTWLGAFFVTFEMWHAGFVGAIRKGVYWRGTFYPNEVLKKGKRFSF
jgi:glycosyltransferase involved in cell wall biosynthesis